MIKTKSVISLLEHVKMDRNYVVCHFKCNVTNKVVVSTVPFEPYNGKIEIKPKDILLHPIKSYHRYYHTPIIIYGKNSQETVVLKAFEKISEYFKWDDEKKQYIYN